jgi:hypothetical protein
MLEEERNRILTKQKQRMKDLQKLLATRVKAYGSHQSLSQIVKARVKELRYHGRAWERQHQLPNSLSFPFLSFPSLSFPFLSFPFLSFPFLSFPFLSFPFLLLN